MVCIRLIILGLFIYTYAYGLKGTVTDTNGAPISDATIQLRNADISVKSAGDGTWSISVPMRVQPRIFSELLPEPIFKGSFIHFSLPNDNNHLKIRIFNLKGRCISTVVDRRLPAGVYHFSPFAAIAGNGMYAIHLQINSASYTFRIPLLRKAISHPFTVSSSVKTVHISPTLNKKLVAIDSIIISKQGYTPVTRAVQGYTDSLHIIMHTAIPEYYLNPPNPCYNRFYVDSCIPGDTNSACGGHCSVANSCSPPEDASKADLPKTFICPRFMLFSTEMLQAAKDDAMLYGWDSADGDSPFNYGVVGHDPDVGGVDDVQSSCCQCYQIIFKKPEPSSPQPPELPYPKPLIVQSFNTAASGPLGFDVFMGAGGYGAFNSCYNDPEFGNTSNFDEFIYDDYPYQNPGMGGISFLRYEECIQGWPPTIDGLNSQGCQEIIEEHCNQARVDANPQVTEDTRRSCIQSNKVESLYHQNWEVMVKRVRCPENLTRVTGCRLKEESLPLPSPEVQTPDDAQTDGTFRDGYHTTTMQDCCKPTCAWADWVVDYGLPVDGEWNSFYSCDKNGIPITR